MFRYRDYLAVVAVVLTLGLMPPREFLGSERADLALDAVGFVVALAGQLLRAVVIGLAYIRRGGRKKEITADRLVADGVFAHSRNPLYVGNFLIVCGLTIMWNSLPAYVLVLGILAVSFLSIVQAEERFLAARFGAEYADYCARVPRFVPNFRNFRQTLARFEFNWKRLVRKEYGTMFAWVTVAIAVFAIEKARWSGFHAAAGRVEIAFALWLVAFAAYATARWLKFAHRLDSSD